MNIEIDNNNNLIVGTHCGMGTNDCIIINNNAEELVSTVGIHNCLIIKQGEELLVVDLTAWMNRKLLPKP